jgi:hypothetical protein
MAGYVYSDLNNAVYLLNCSHKLTVLFQEVLTCTSIKGLMFVLGIIRRSRNNQHYALICTTPLFYTLAPTCFGSSLPSSGSFLDLSELLEIQTEWVVHHIMYGYVCGLSWFHLYCASQLLLGSTVDGTTTLWHTGHITTHCMIHHPFDLYFN